MLANDERALKLALQDALGVRQGLHPKHGGGRLRAFCAATGRRYSTVANKLNAAGAKASRFLAQVDAGLLVDAIVFTRNLHPLRTLARIVRERLGRRGRKQRNPQIEVAA